MIPASGNLSEHNSVEESPRVCPACGERSWKRLFEHQDVSHGLGNVFTVVQCAVCDLVSYTPLPDEETLQTFYPPDYYAYRQEMEPLENNRWRLLLDDLHLGIRRSFFLSCLLFPLLWYKKTYSSARFLRNIPRGRLLDVGCGDGAFLRKASRMGFECYGLEPGGGETVQMRAAGKEIPLFRCSLDAFSGYAGFFDVITLHHVFEHLPRPGESLEKLKTLLKPGGRMLIRMPRTDHFLFRRQPADWFPLEMPRHVYLYTPENFARLAARHGWSVLSVQAECIPAHYLYALKKMVFGKPFLSPHWLDARVFSMLLLPFCEILKWCGQADCMALWLASSEWPGAAGEKS